jgi:hypothetical protein
MSQKENATKWFAIGLSYEETGEAKRAIIIQFIYLTACQQRIAYNRRALNIHTTAARLDTRLVIKY